MEQSQRSELSTLIHAVQTQKPIILFSAQQKNNIEHYLVKLNAVQFSKFLQSHCSPQRQASVAHKSQPTTISQVTAISQAMPIDQKVIVIDLPSNHIACAVQLLNHMQTLAAGDSKIFLNYIIQAGEYYDLSYAELLTTLDFFGIEEAFDLFVSQAKPEFLPHSKEEELAQNQEIVKVFAIARKKGMSGEQCDESNSLWVNLGCMLYPYCTKYTEIREIVSFIVQHKNLEKIVLGEYMQKYPVLFNHHIYTLMGHAKKIIGIEFDTNDQWISTKSHDETIRVWDIEHGSLMQMRKSTAKLWSLVAFNGLNTVFAGVPSIASVPQEKVELYMRTVNVFRTCDKSLIRSIIFPSQQYITAMALSNSGSLIAIGLSNKTMQLFDLSNGAIIRTYTDFDSLCTAIDFDSEDSVIVTGSNYGTVQLWNIQTGSLIRTMHSQDECSPQSITAICFHPHSYIIASARMYGSLELWDSTTGEQLFSYPKNTAFSCAASLSRDSMMTALRCNDSGTVLAAGLEDGTCILWGYTSLFDALSASVSYAPVSDRYLSLEDEVKPFIMEPFVDAELFLTPDQGLDPVLIDPLENFPIDRPLLPAKHARR